jgi:hypothetical protein
MSYPPMTMIRFSEIVTPGAKSGCGYGGNFFQPKQNKPILLFKIQLNQTFIDILCIENKGTR